jgi:carboxyl-terminal processing protease
MVSLFNKLPKINLKVLRKGFITFGLIIISFSLGYAVGFKKLVISSNKLPEVKITREVPQEVGELNFSLFWKVWDIVSSKYFDKTKVIPSNLVYGAIRGMVAAVGDPYTAFFAPSENKIIEDDLQGNFDGVGIQIGFRGTKLTVITPLPESPADKAGVKPGDYIVGIKDETKGVLTTTEGMSLPEAIALIRGKAGSSVTLTLVRDGSGKPITVTLVRETITVASVTLKIIEENDSPVKISGPVAYIKVAKFGAETNSEWNDAVIEILKKGDLQGVIVDVRNNPGGYLEGAVDLASEFLDTGDTVVIEDDGKGNTQEDKVTVLGRLKKEKVVVLINGGSASASEIFSGALRDDKKIKLVGETSFGKGTIQEPEQLDGGSGLHITIAKWLTPSEYWVNEKGLKPDVEVADNPDTEEDEQLTAALRLLSEN